MTEQVLDDAWVSGIDNPIQAVQMAEAATSVATPAPVISVPTDGPVNLPGGFRRLVGNLETVTVKTAWVRELNGEHEERIFRAISKSDGNLNVVVQTILECGVERLGDQQAAPEELKSLLVGDRDYLLLEISAATYGENVDYDDFPCPSCRRSVSFAVRLHEDVPVTTQDDLSMFTVKLRKGKSAKVRLVTGADSDDLPKNLSIAEANSIILQKIVREIQTSDELITVEDDPDVVRTLLSIPDRKDILEEVFKRMPGPRYNEVTFTHEDCGNEIAVPFGLLSLFPGLV